MLKPKICEFCRYEREQQKKQIKKNQLQYHRTLMNYYKDRTPIL